MFARVSRTNQVLPLHSSELNEYVDSSKVLDQQSLSLALSSKRSESRQQVLDSFIS